MRSIYGFGTLKDSPTSSTVATLKSGIASQIRTDLRFNTSTSRAAAQVQDAVRAANTVQREVVDQIRTSSAPAPTFSAKCQCLVTKASETAAAQGAALDNATMSALLQACALDERSFESSMKQAGVKVDACGPFWKRRSTLMIGAGVLAALVVWKVAR